ncbi:peptidase family S58-domain-containing protein [Xylariales sp. PMI_506]|nr:peptidase family S58-domain-containing protein [Xylariales sp. PMI_506]
MSTMIVHMEQRRRIRDLGYAPGKFSPGPRNSILDIAGLQVGQVTLHQEPGVHTGITLIFPRGVKGTPLRPCYGATHDLNGAGEMTGCHMLQEWGYLSSPIAITNTLSIGKAYDALFIWGLEEAYKRGEIGEDALRRFSIPIVAETFDGYLNNILASAIDKSVVLEAISAAEHQAEVLEGNHGGGTAMICHGYKGGTGTSSRIIPGAKKNYTLGVLVQANHGQKADLRIGNVPVGKLLMEEDRRLATAEVGAEEFQNIPVGGKAMEGSIIIVVATDAPLLPHQLKRLAKHASMGVTQVSGHAAGRNFSGEIFLAFSTGTSPDKLAEESSGMDYLPPVETQTVETTRNETMDSLLYAVSEATEEAILNAMCQAETLTGQDNRIIKALPLERVQILLDKYMVGHESKPVL